MSSVDRQSEKAALGGAGNKGRQTSSRAAKQGKRRFPVRVPEYTVFFSYAHEDLDDVRHVLTHLQAAPALRVFLDTARLEGGQAYEPALRENIAICDELIVLATPASVARDWVLMEIGAAWILGKRMAPIVNGVSRDELPEPLRDVQLTQLTDLEPLLRRLRRRASVGARAKDDRPWTDVLEALARGAKVSPSTVTALVLEGRAKPPRQLAFIVPRIVALMAPSVWDRRKAQRAVLCASPAIRNEVCRVLKQLARSDDPFIRGEALFSLGRFRASGALSALRTALRDPHPYVNACAANGLRFVGDDTVKAELQELVTATEGSSELEGVHYYAWNTVYELEQRGT